MFSKVGFLTQSGQGSAEKLSDRSPSVSSPLYHAHTLRYLRKSCFRPGTAELDTMSYVFLSATLLLSKNSGVLDAQPRIKTANLGKPRLKSAKHWQKFEFKFDEISAKIDQMEGGSSFHT